MKLPAIQFYPGDWRKDPGVQSLTFEERGIWFELILLMHESEERGKLLLGGKPYPVERLARTLRIDETLMGGVISTLITLNVASVDEKTGAIMCRRMVRDEEKVRKCSEAGKLGGNPAFQKGKGNPYYQREKDKGEDKGDIRVEDKRKITPSSSSSSSSSSSDKKKDNPLTPAAVRKQTKFVAAEAIPIPESLDTPRFREAWSAWISHRTEIKKKLTATGAMRQLSALLAMGEPVAVAAIDRSISGGYQGIFEPRNGNGHPPPAEDRGYPSVIDDDSGDPTPEQLDDLLGIKPENRH